MSNQLLEQYVRIQVAINGFISDLHERMREQRGQTTVEWLAIMVGLVALAGALAISSVWKDIGDAIGKAVTTLINNATGKSS